MDKKLFIVLGANWAFLSAVALAALQPCLTRLWGEIRTLQFSFVCMSLFYILFSFLSPATSWISFVIISLFSVSAISYPLSVGLATREVNPEEQGNLQGAVSILETTGKILAPLLASDVLIPMFEKT